jgi:hypothetical protein
MAGQREINFRNIDLGRKLIISETSDGILRAFIFAIVSTSSHVMVASIHGPRAKFHIDPLAGNERYRCWIDSGSFDVTADELDAITQKFSLRGREGV